MIDYRNNNKWLVYIHTSPNNKHYVGITCQNVEKRWGISGYNYQKNKYFDSAIKKYGWDNFNHEIIAEHLTKNEACALEVSLINVLKSNNRDFGYNHTAGGDGRPCSEPVDLTGKIFGRWTVLCKTDVETLHKSYNNHYWKCQCACGNIKDVIDASLLRGTSTSCGCIHKEILSKRHLGKCTYDISNEYGIGTTQNGYIFLFDLADYDLIKQYNWIYLEDRKRIIYNANKKRILMHKIILGLSNSRQDIIYISGDYCDLRRSNIKMRDSNDIKELELYEQLVETA